MIAHYPLHRIVRAGLAGGLAGGACIWVYEAVVWAGVQHLLPLAAIPANATGLMFGKTVQQGLGIWASVLGTLTHFGFAVVWGIGFAAIWPPFARRGWEATTLALPFALVLWVVMHAAITLAGHEHPNYLDPNVMIGGVMSHLFFAVPLALVVRNVRPQRETD
ncbi:hypothetical protein [Novosphingobium sp.]|uniref:hypothetical protein n=1 Tax=Novosphingobium sp. TaxID=1874826 RepID=UPI00334283B7